MRRERRIEEERKNKKNVLKRLLIIFLILLLIGVGTVAFLLYGPYPNFREWLITTAMTTMNHQYFATIFYDDSTIEEVLSKHVVIEPEENTNPELTEIKEIEPEKIEYANEYERAVLEKDPDNDVYKIIELEGDGYTGYMDVVYDPSRIKTVVTKKLGVSGQYLVKMAEENNALLAINGGGFDDPNFNSNGGSPAGITISDGKVINSSKYASSRGGVIGFTEENKLVLGKFSIKEAQEMGIRDAVSFAPFLIVNGEPSFVQGNGGWGTAPRTAIGQRQDGIVLFVVIDGRTITRPGVDMVQLTEIMQNYGAYNAANLDGGTSSVMVVNNEIINDPIDSTGAHKTRPIATGFIVTSE